VGGEHPVTSKPAGHGRFLAALVLIGLALRPQVIFIGPIVGELQADLGMSHAVAGLLGTIPVLCMGILAPLGPVLAGSIGPRLGAAACVALIGVFGLARAVMPDSATVLLATVGVGVGMAVVGPILPMIVRHRAPDHPAAGTGAYVAGLILGGSIAAAIVVPLADGLGGWRPAFAAISAAAGISLVAWLVLVPADHGARTRPSLPGLPWRRGSAWLFGLAFGTQSTLFYGAITWLASAYIERGWTAAEAAGLAAFLNGVGLLASLSIPLLADRIGTRRSQMTFAAAMAVSGAVGIALTPGEPSGSLVAFGATGLLGIGIGAFFPLALTLPVDAARSPSEAASISALMLLIGYLLSSIAPVFLGLIRDATGNFELVLWVLVGLAIAMIPLALALGPGRLRRAEAV
jgi:CP family cyanate transporter-like MFS transporter